MSDTGATISSDSAPAQDPLFRKFMMWTWGFFGLVFMGMQMWLVASVADIKATLPRLSDKDNQVDLHFAATDKRVDRLEDRQDILRSRVDQLDGRGLRGADPKDPRRGN